MGQPRTIYRNLCKVNFIIILDTCQARQIQLRGRSQTIFLNLYKVIYKNQNLHMRKYVVY